MFKILILVGKSPILLNLIPTNIDERMSVPSSYMYPNIYSKANVNYLLQTHTAYQDIMYLSNFNL